MPRRWSYPELPPSTPGQSPLGLVALPWHLNRRGEHLGAGPEAILDAGLADWLTGGGITVDGPQIVELSPAERTQYGGWNAVGLTGGHLATTVATLRGRGAFPLALLGDCNGSLGMIGGLQRAGVRRLGMIWFDAHADFNTPETTLSGYLGGMPVATAAGLCLHRIRGQTGIVQPLLVEDIVLAGVRDTDPYEQQLVEALAVARIPTEAFAQDTAAVQRAVRQLATRCDAIYVHIDLDVLDPVEAPGMNLPVAGGPSVAALSAAIACCLLHPRTAALGIASYNAPKDENERTLHAVFKLIAGAVSGLAARTT